MTDALIREIAIAGHWRAADPTAEIYITDFNIKNLRVWVIPPRPRTMGGAHGPCA